MGRHPGILGLLAQLPGTFRASGALDLPRSKILQSRSRSSKIPAPQKRQVEAKSLGGQKGMNEMSLAEVTPQQGALKDLYQIGEIPPLGHVPANMYAWA